MKLIELNAAIEALKRAEALSRAFGYHAVIDAVEALPTVDAVPVRCKDCKFFSHGYCRFHDAKFVRPDGYCYWGEKEGEPHD